nr:hypothetical protein [Microbacterium sp. CH12i]
MPMWAERIPCSRRDRRREDDRLEARCAAGDGVNVGERLDLFDQHLQPDATDGETCLLLELAEQGVHEPDILGGFDLRNDEDVEIRTGTEHHVGDVVEEPRGGHAVDAHGTRLVSPVERVERFGRLGPRHTLGVRGDCIFEIEEDEVCIAGGSLAIILRFVAGVDSSERRRRRGRPFAWWAREREVLS